MVTSFTDFDTTYSVNDGEVASEVVLNRPTLRLKKELNEVDLYVQLMLGDYSNIPDWVAGTYEKNSVVKHSLKYWKALVTTSGEPGVSADWFDLTALLSAFMGLTTGAISGEGSTESFATLANFPVTGELSKIYIDESTNRLYRWTGSDYTEVSISNSVIAYASSSAFPVTGLANILYVANDSNIIYRWNGSSYSAVSSPTSAAEVLEFVNFSGFPGTGELAKIYVAKDTNKMYRWSGSAYLELAPGSGSVDVANNLNGGTAGTLVYQSAPNTSGFVTAPVTSETYLKWNGSTFVWSAVASGSTITIADDTVTDSTFYPMFVDVNTGAPTVTSVSSTKLQFNPLAGNLSSTTFTSLSDIAKKENVLTAPSDITSKLRGVEFTWKDTGKKSSGVIAQEISEVLPHLIEELEDGTLTVNYMALSAYLIESIKSLELRISELEA